VLFIHAGSCFRSYNFRVSTAHQYSQASHAVTADEHCPSATPPLRCLVPSWEVSTLVPRGLWQPVQAQSHKIGCCLHFAETITPGMLLFLVPA
jgi:hypothetical protein